MPQIDQDFFAWFCIVLDVFLCTIFTLQEFLTNDRMEVLLIRTGIPENDFPMHVVDNPKLEIRSYIYIGLAALIVTVLRIVCKSVQGVKATVGKWKRLQNEKGKPFLLALSN